MPEEPAQSFPIVLQEGTILRGQYRIDRVLGAGNFGITYLARDQRLETAVAIKEYFPRQVASRSGEGKAVEHDTGAVGEDFKYGLDRFLQEGQTLAQFDHPNIVRVRSYFEENGTGYLVMDYYEGQTLDAYLSQQGETISETEALDIIEGVLDGLRVVHKEGVLHRDIDPNNVYLTESGESVLIDFGAAREAIGERSQSLTTILKPGYAPYEQYHEDGNQGPHTDVYACAATLYRCLAGRRPTEAVGRVREDPLDAPHQVNPSISMEVSLAVMKGLAVRPRERVQSASAFAELLLESQGKGGPTQGDSGTVVPDTVEAPTAEKDISTEEAGEEATVDPSDIAGPTTDRATSSIREDESRLVAPSWHFDVLQTAGIAVVAALLGGVTTALVGGTGLWTLGMGVVTGNRTGTGPASNGTVQLASADELRRAPVAGVPSLTENGDMVQLPAGMFVMGLTDEDPSQRQNASRKRVSLSPFRIDRFEVTNVEYRDFLSSLSASERQKRRPDSTVASGIGNWRTYFYGPERRDYPVLGVTWDDARAYCEWAGKRLPTEAEWEYAARAGRVGSIYPWAGLSTTDSSGNYLANFSPRGRAKATLQPRPEPTADGYAFTAPVGSFPPNRWGLHDMAGNVAEWVRDAYSPTYDSSFIDPVHKDPDEPKHVVRGGSWSSNAFEIGVGAREPYPGNEASRRIGFRCAANVPQSSDLQDTTAIGRIVYHRGPVTVTDGNEWVTPRSSHLLLPDDSIALERASSQVQIEWESGREWAFDLSSPPGTLSASSIRRFNRAAQTRSIGRVDSVAFE